MGLRLARGALTLRSMPLFCATPSPHTSLARRDQREIATDESNIKMEHDPSGVTPNAILPSVWVFNTSPRCRRRIKFHTGCFDHHSFDITTITAETHFWTKVNLKITSARAVDIRKSTLKPQAFV